MDVSKRILSIRPDEQRAVLFPESEESTIRQACARLADGDALAPVLLASPEERDAAVSDPCLRDRRVRCITLDEPLLERLAEEYVDARKTLSLRAAKRLMKHKLFAAGMLLRLGEADGVVAGLSHPTAVVLQAAGLTVGLAPQVSAASSFFLMALKEPLEGQRDILFFADAAVQVSPDSGQLAEIASLTARNATKLLPGFRPRVAFLSFSTLGSADSPELQKVREAVSLARQRDPETLLEGELQADAALIPRVARKKKAPDEVAGRANVLIFPDLNSGNIAYKLTQYLAHAQALGPILQGFNRPFNDLSRGASVEDVILVAHITALCAQQDGGVSRA